VAVCQLVAALCAAQQKGHNTGRQPRRTASQFNSQDMPLVLVQNCRMLLSRRAAVPCGWAQCTLLR
jgi:hypothetical protein